MNKYLITLVPLLCLVLAHKSNIYARSHPNSDEGENLPLSRTHLQSQPRNPVLQHVQHTSQQHHTRQHRDRQPKHIAPDPTGSEEEQFGSSRQDQREYYQRLRRHLQRQREHMLQQERSYHRISAQVLKNSPNLWQLLSQGYQIAEPEQEQTAEGQSASDKMFNDTPATPPVAVMDDIEDYLNYSEGDRYGDFAKELQQLHHELPKPEAVKVSAPINYTTVNPKIASGGCTQCESSRHVEHISEDELRRLRIEFVKQQILEKLRLKESPNVSAMELPLPIFEGITLPQTTEANKNKDFDDYYARTNQKFILLQREETECNRLGVHPSMCFSFKIDDADADGFDVNSAVLWLYKNNQNYTKASNGETQLNEKLRKQTLVVSEVEQQQMDSKYLPLAKTIAIQSVDVQDEWMKINIEWPIKRWFGNHDLSHLLQITCESCDISGIEEIISVNKNYRPFIMIDTQNRQTKSRQKRNINCSNGVTECCREKLYISFADIGWDNWILQPKGYDAYFCRGSCSSVASVAQAASHHSSLLKILSSNGTRKPLDLVPCCTAKQYSSLQLVVVDSNNTATVKTLPNMIVESCGCR